jgi:APA family basic amino acid/polyamine antiporter
MRASPEAAQRGLARTLRTTEYFALAFGTMVGVGWLIIIDDWLSRGGPGGAMLGFLLGGLALIPVAYVYGKFVSAVPDAGGELAYANLVFPKSVAFITGWLMTLAYLIVCPWEAVAIGKILAYIFPSIRSYELYRIGGFPVYLPTLLAGLCLSLWIIYLNYRGIRLSSKFQNATTFGLLALFAIFCLTGLSRFQPENLRPFFAHSADNALLGAAVSVILVLQIVPYFLTGFESVPKCSEESDVNFERRNFAVSIYLGLAAGVIFYVLILAVVSGLVPWQSISGERYATAVAFSRAFNTSWIVRLILIAALFSLLKVFNANFLTASRLIFALGRQRLIPSGMSEIHSRFQSPKNAILFCGLITIFGALLGDSILIPVTEVGTLCSACGWAITCLAFMRWIHQTDAGPRARTSIAIACIGTAVATLFLLLKLIPQIPGSFRTWEYIALGLWLAFGLCLRLTQIRAPALQSGKTN